MKASKLFDLVINFENARWTLAWYSDNTNTDCNCCDGAHTNNCDPEYEYDIANSKLWITQFKDYCKDNNIEWDLPDN